MSASESGSLAKDNRICPSPGAKLRISLTKIFGPLTSRSTVG